MVEDGGGSQAGGLALDPSLPVPLAMVVAGLDALAAATPADLPPAQALLVTQVLLVQQDRLRALALRHVADVDRRELHALDDSPSTAAWVAEQQTSMTRGEVGLAKSLDRTPQLADRIAAGGITLDAGIRISRALRRLRPYVDRPDGRIEEQPGEPVLRAVVVDGVVMLVGEALGGIDDDDPRLVRLVAELSDIAARPQTQIARLEAAFLVLARCVEPRQLPGALDRLVDAVLPQALADRADRAFVERRLELHRDDDDGGWTIRGRLDLECGELLHTALTAAMATDADKVNDTANAAALRAQGLDPYEDGCLQVRSVPQRRHDGLRLLLRRLLDSGALGTRGKVVPHIGVTISEQALHAEAGAVPARAASGTNVPLSLVRRWLCDSAVTRFVLSLGHRVVESSHTERTAKPHERRIKELETGGVCQAAGCCNGTATGHRLIPHHATPYAIDPVTSLADTVLLCDVSHHDLHEGERNVRLKDGRVLTPTGWLAAAA